MNILKTINYILYFDWLKKQSRSYIEKIREDSLRKMVDFAFKNSSFYRKLYEDAGIKEKDIPYVNYQDLPTTNKRLLMQHFDEAVTDKELKFNEIEKEMDKHPKERLHYKNRYEMMHSSGTSGISSIIPIDVNDLPITMAAINSFIFSPIKFMINNFRKCKTLNCVVVGPRAGTVLYFYMGHKLLSDKHFFSILDPFENNYDTLNKIQPDVISGYSSAMKRLAIAQLNKQINIKPQFVVCSGDLMDEQTKDIIRQAFHTEAIGYYSSTENLFMGFKTHENYFSILDPICYMKDNCVSNLYCKTLPIIKYQMDDIVDHIEDYKDNPFTKVYLHSERISDEIQLFNNEGKLFALDPYYIATIHMEGLQAFQVCKKENNSLLIRAVGNHFNIKNKIEKTFNSILKLQQAEEKVKFQVEILDKIPVDPKSGKFKMFIP